MARKKKKVIYFGHPVNTYAPRACDGGKLEKQLMSDIQSMHPDCIIENPNQPKHQEGYQKWSEKEGKRGMDYFYEEILPNCDEGVFLAFRDGKWGAGVFGEAKAMANAGKKIFEIFKNVNWYITPIAISVMSNHVLTVKETRARIRDENGNPLPY